MDDNDYDDDLAITITQPFLLLRNKRAKIIKLENIQTICTTSLGTYYSCKVLWWDGQTDGHTMDRWYLYYGQKSQHHCSTCFMYLVQLFSKRPTLFLGFSKYQNYNRQITNKLMACVCGLFLVLLKAHYFSKTCLMHINKMYLLKKCDWRVTVQLQTLKFALVLPENLQYFFFFLSLFTC